MTETRFLTDEDVLRIHAVVIREYGGGELGLRDLGLLSSAVAQPSVTFDGKYLHPDLFSMAAALLFSLAKNHAFVDGNKRTAVASMETFLRLDRVVLADDATDALVDLTMAVARNETEKDAVAEALRELAAGVVAED